LYAEQLRAGEQYHELRPARVICVLAETVWSGSDRLHTDFRRRDEVGHVLTDDLQVHLLELTKLTVTRDNLKMATSVERWAFFFLNADQLTLVEIQELFPEPEFAEAAGVLKVIKDTPEQMDTYISRLKSKLDEDWRIEATRSEALREGEARGRTEGQAEGRQEGLKAGELIGRIETLREVLGLVEPTREQLQSYDAPQLTILCERLQLQLRSRQS
jgi:predicted transposase/invertase (TIGR01784 family)